METNTYKVAAVVVTYNRIKFLQEIIPALRNQTRKPDQIIVIHNSGTDGTAEWLATQKDLEVITQPNVGSSGGQYTGFKTAYEGGYDWIWIMDDDVIPRPDCLEKLLYNPQDTSIVRAPLRYASNGTVFFNECQHINLSNPFKSLWSDIISPDSLKNPYIQVEGITFEGPLFHRNIIEKTGLPEKKFFIYADDTEYIIRAESHGAKAILVRDAVLDRRLPYTREELKFTWKHKYIIRNIIAIDVLHGTCIVRLLRPFAYLLKWLTHCKSLSDFKVTFSAFFNGYFYKSNN